MKVCREISWFVKDGEDCVGDVNVDNIPLEFLIEIFNPAEDDPLLILVYTIESDKSKRLAEWVDVDFDYKKYQYFLYCWQA